MLTGIVRQAEDLLQKGKAPLLKIRKDKNLTISTKDIFEVAAEGDKDIKQLLQYVFEVLGFTLANIAVTTNPSKIVIGGGVSKAGVNLLAPLKKKFEVYTLPRTNDACEFVLAKLGNDAGVYGGAYLVIQNS